MIKDPESNVCMRIPHSFSLSTDHKPMNPKCKRPYPFILEASPVKYFLESSSLTTRQLSYNSEKPNVREKALDRFYKPETRPRFPEVCPLFQKEETKTGRVYLMLRDHSLAKHQDFL